MSHLSSYFIADGDLNFVSLFKIDTILLRDLFQFLVFRDDHKHTSVYTNSGIPRHRAILTHGPSGHLPWGQISIGAPTRIGAMLKCVC